MNKVRYFVIIAAIIILIIELFLIDYSNFKWNNTLSLLVPILLIISMSGSIWSVNKHEKNS